MEMSYFFSSTVYDFLFSGVNVVTTWGMVSLCMGLATLSLLAEGFKVARSLLLKVATSSHRSGCSRYTTQERSPLLPHNFRTVSEMQKLLYIRRVKFHILQTFLHIIHLTIGYVLMLAVMTYNAYFTIAVVGGAGLGYYCFSLFDLPSRVLGNLSPSSAKWPVYQSPQLQSAGNSPTFRSSYGAAGSVPSPVGPHVLSQLEQVSHVNVGTASVEAVGEATAEKEDSTRMDDVIEEEKLLTGAVTSSEEEQERLRGASVMVDISDRTSLLPQDTIKVEVHAHAMSEG